MSGTIRVVVADDSITVRKRIVEILDGAPGIEVVAEVADGDEAIRSCAELRPDVVTLDMMMPVTGLEATEQIMAYTPTPIVIVSASLERREVLQTLDALAAGAVDVVEKPAPGEEDVGWPQDLVAAVRRAARIRVIRHLRASLAASHRRREPAVPDPERLRHRLIAIGASTGGPAAVLAILRCLPRDFPLPIAVVLHLSEGFQFAVADWLDGLVGLPVADAVDGEPIARRGRPGVVLAPPGAHLLVAGDRWKLDRGPERNWCRPAVDVLFESLAARRDAAEVVACLLTGMGRDGAAGLAALRSAGATTIVQDRETSVVWGMPGAAVELGAAGRILPLSEIAPALIEAVTEPRAEAG